MISKAFSFTNTKIYQDKSMQGEVTFTSVCSNLSNLTSQFY